MKKIKKNLKWVTILILVAIAVICILLKRQLKKESLPKEKEEEIQRVEEIVEPDEEEKNIFYIDIKGAVVNPGVYEIEEGKKVIDVIQLAGGFSENADSSLINLAKMVSNEMVIIVYTTEEVKKVQEEEIAKVVDNQCICPAIKNDACLIQEEETKTEEQVKTEIKNKININIASLEELQTLTGIGESKAEAIIKYREEHGTFQKIEELLEVSGIGEALYEKIKDDITV